MNDKDFFQEDKVFQQITEDNLDFLKEDVQNQLGQYFPSVTIVSLDVLGQEDDMIITVNLKYRVINTGISDEINITFE